MTTPCWTGRRRGPMPPLVSGLVLSNPSSHAALSADKEDSQDFLEFCLIRIWIVVVLWCQRSSKHCIPGLLACLLASPLISSARATFV